jgi:hypothetical protein
MVLSLFIHSFIGLSQGLKLRGPRLNFADLSPNEYIGEAIGDLSGTGTSGFHWYLSSKTFLHPCLGLLFCQSNQ